jgi:predicted Zn-dependent protease
MKKFIAIVLFLLCASLNLFVGAFAATVDSPHWQLKNIPVYIPNDTYSPTMRNAFKRWQNETGGKINFVFVAKEAAKVEVSFTDRVDGSDGPFASYSIVTSGNAITSANLKFATKGSKKYSKDEVYSSMLHEIGHILGLSEATRKKSSIMFMPTPTSKDILKLDVRNLYKVSGWSYSDRRISN